MVESTRAILFILHKIHLEFIPIRDKVEPVNTTRAPKACGFFCTLKGFIMSIFDFYNDLKLKAPVGNNLQNNDDDVRTVRVGLEALGHFGQSERERDVYGKPLGMITAQMDEKIRAFQRQENLKEDGRANPGGETITTMSKRLKEKQLAVESPPAYRKEVFKGTRLQEWETFNRKLENNPKFTPNERQIIRDI